MSTNARSRLDSGKYIPTGVPQRLDESLLPWLQKELTRIGNARPWDRGTTPEVGQEPERPQAGDTAFADGTEWNPGAGRGLYYWDGSAWVFTGAVGGGGVTDHGALTGLSDPDHPIAAVSGLQAALDGKEPGLGNPGVSGYVLSSTAAGVRSWVPQPSAGVTDHGALTGLSDPDHPIAAVSGLQAALDGKEPGLGNPASNGYVLQSTTAGSRSWVDPSTFGGGGGASWAHYLAEYSAASLTSSKQAIGWDDETDPDGLASISGNDIIFASEGWYLIHLVGDLGIGSSSSSTLRRFRVYLDWNDLDFWSISGEVSQHGTRCTVTLIRPWYMYVNDQLNLFIGNDQGTFGTFNTNIYLSLLKLG